MVRYCEQETTFHHPWHEVVQAFWSRYPNPHSGHVLTEDTVQRQLAADGCLRSKRVVTKTNRMPRWGERFLAARTVAVLEESACEPARRRLVTLTHNLGHTHLMTVTERVEYTADPRDAGSTLVRREAWVGSPVFGVGYAIQAFGIDRFKKNLTKTVLGFNYVLNKMFPRQKLEDLVTDHPAALSAMDARKERLRETAKKATELAKSRAGSMVAHAACAEKES